MATETKLPITRKAAEPTFPGSAWQPFESLRKEVDRLFDDIGEDFWRRPFRSLSNLERNWTRHVTIPAVDVAENDRAYEITAELPGMDEKNVEVSITDGGITIKGEKKEQTEDKNSDYYVSERRYGAFERYFALPEGIDTGNVEATFKNGILKVVLPKTAEAQKTARKIEVKAG
jgi:HSP20 family protein